MNYREPRRGGERRCLGGFSRAELLACLAGLCVIGLVAGPAWGSSKGQGRAVVCRQNLRTLIWAWQLYSHDHAGKLPGNPLGSGFAEVVAERTNSFPWASGWLDWNPRADNTNRALLTDYPYARLAQYLPKRTRAHKCPEDIYLSGQQKGLGWEERVRSVAMNASVGVEDAFPPAMDLIYDRVKTIDGFVQPSPREVAVIFEEHPDSINDAMFNPPQETTWTDVAAGFHRGGMTAAFGDGSVRIHHWRGPTRNWRVGSHFSIPVLANDPDLSWLSYHSARVSEKHY